MKQLIILFSIIVFSKNNYCVLSNVNDLDNSFINDSTILWKSNIKLTWNDFQGAIPNEDIGIKNAETSSEIIIEGDFLEGDIPKFTVISIFHKKESWTKTMDKDVLIHEQLHFDITELIARRIRKRFSELNANDEINHKVYIDEYYKFREKEVYVQNRYDNEVYFNKTKQQEWIDRIEKELEELKEYHGHRPN